MSPEPGQRVETFLISPAIVSCKKKKKQKMSSKIVNIFARQHQDKTNRPTDNWRSSNQGKNQASHNGFSPEDYLDSEKLDTWWADGPRKRDGGDKNPVDNPDKKRLHFLFPLL